VSAAGFVKEDVTYIITNDLNILPASTIACMTLLNQLHVKELSDLKKRTVKVEVLGLLGTSLTIKDLQNARASTIASKTGVEMCFL